MCNPVSTGDCLAASSCAEEWSLISRMHSGYQKAGAGCLLSNMLCSLLSAGIWYECLRASTCGWKVLGRCEVWMTNVALEAGGCAAGACWTRVTLAEMICRQAPRFQQPPEKFHIST